MDWVTRDNYKCVICGLGKKEGIELHIDHIKPKDLGGKATLQNGQTLCARHNFLKKNFKQTEMGKKMFIRMLETAKENDNKELIAFLKKCLKCIKSTIPTGISCGKSRLNIILREKYAKQIL